MWIRRWGKKQGEQTDEEDNSVGIEMRKRILWIRRRWEEQG